MEKVDITKIKLPEETEKICDNLVYDAANKNYLCVITTNACTCLKYNSQHMLSLQALMDCPTRNGPEEYGMPQDLEKTIIAEYYRTTEKPLKN